MDRHGRRGGPSTLIRTEPLGRLKTRKGPSRGESSPVLVDRWCVGRQKDPLEAVGRHQQAATDPQAYAVAQRGEGTINDGRGEGRDHILKVEYVNMGPPRQDPNASMASVRRRADASRLVCDRGARQSHQAG